MSEIKTKYHKKGNKIMIELQPEFLVGDKVFSKYNLEETILDRIEYEIYVCESKKKDEKDLIVKVNYGHNCSLSDYSQVSGCYSIAHSKKAAAKLWFDDEKSLLGLGFYQERMSLLRAKFKNDPEFLKKIEENYNKIIQEYKQKIKNVLFKQVKERIEELANIEKLEWSKNEQG
jgi:hypothetical protein